MAIWVHFPTLQSIENQAFWVTQVNPSLSGNWNEYVRPLLVAPFPKPLRSGLELCYSASMPCTLSFLSDAYVRATFFLNSGRS